ncbi:MAG TPA: hypothetical protein PKA41_13830 [Verrucomicrobiota bacterium]|nr:hypothetical protein [Verrucomicrobiota bacterium]
MKRIFLITAAVFPLMLSAQDEPVDKPSFYDFTMLERGSAHHAITTQRYDSVANDGYIYTGIVIQLVLAPQPLQLVNPLSPPEYGNGEQNLSLDPMTKRPMGLNLFAISF